MLGHTSTIAMLTAMVLLFVPAVTVGGPTADAALRDGSCGPAGSLAEARSDHTSTLLPDGWVLIVGGEQGPAMLATAEVWDPASEDFSPAGSMAEGRKLHTATLLPDGRVLVSGGAGNPAGYGDPFLATAEIWDPASGQWTATGPLDQWRAEHTATLLGDGRVLIVGGGAFTRDGFDTFDYSEAWDPVAGSFVPAGRLATARLGHSSTRLSDGRVLVVGGTLLEARRAQPRREATHPLLRADRFDPRRLQRAHPLQRSSGVQEGRRRRRGTRRPHRSRQPERSPGSAADRPSRSCPMAARWSSAASTRPDATWPPPRSVSADVNPRCRPES